MFLEYGKELSEAISKETSGDFEKLLSRVLKVWKIFPFYFIPAFTCLCFFHIFDV